MSAIEVTVQAVNDNVGLPIREIIECMRQGKFNRLEVKEISRQEHGHHSESRYLLFVEDTEGNKTVQRIDVRPEPKIVKAPKA